ncbi:hypothetical protein C2G38_2036547 [Gigaspora rosea]|uniref:Uncharacterized protein n=1 Tax=Gigaspora rosea TaxID=44941 RepID=A0A397V9Y2_9GLOM|nr:hypothetical protein C2G38_2036547 [Gigaspora rosea]
MHLLRSIARKYPSFDYNKCKGVHDIHGFSNPLLARTESIRIWWVMNWPHRQKIIETLPFKPNISLKLWKAVAFGSHVNLQDFTYKNLLSSIKEAEDEHILQSAKGGTISIKRRSYHTIFADISEWLLAFKAYMNAVLIIYENREHELNAYRDHISKLCLRQNFHAVMSYDEDRRVTLITNWDSTLLGLRNRGRG